MFIRMLRECAFGFTCLAMLLWAVPAVYAAPVSTMTWRTEAAPSGFCVLGTFDNAAFNVFGTTVNFGTQAGGFSCTGSLVGPAFIGHCDSQPDASQWGFDFSVPASLTFQPGIPTPFVGISSNVTGTIATALGNLTYTLDGTDTQRGVMFPATTIPGCPIVGAVDVHDGIGGLNAFQSTATGTGTNVALSTTSTYTDPNTGNPTSAAVDITFDNVTSGGSTLVTATSNAAGDLTNNFKVDIGGYQATFIDVTTTASFSNNITICQHYNDADNDGYVDGTGVLETSLRFLHSEGGTFVDRTLNPPDPMNNIICAQVTSLSPFVIGVAVAMQSTHDGVVLPPLPLKVTIPKGKTELAKTLKVKVQNADFSDSTGHTAHLSISASTCPASLLLDTLHAAVVPDFNAKSAGSQDSTNVLPGKVVTARVALTLKRDDFTSASAKSPLRCTITFTTSTIAPGTVIDPNVSNNTAKVEIDVIDRNDF